MSALSEKWFYSGYKLSKSDTLRVFDWFTNKSVFFFTSEILTWFNLVHFKIILNFTRVNAGPDPKLGVTLYLPLHSRYTVCHFFLIFDCYFSTQNLFRRLLRQFFSSKVLLKFSCSEINSNLFWSILAPAHTLHFIAAMRDWASQWAHCRVLVRALLFIMMMLVFLSFQAISQKPEQSSMKHIIKYYSKESNK